MRRLAPLVVLLVALGAPSAQAAESVTAAALAQGEAIIVDGVMDEEAWQRAEVVDQFVGVAPTEGFEPAGETRVRVLVDDKHLYCFFEARFDEPTRVRGYLSEREDINRDDQVAIQIDPFGDGRRAYMFWINALGVQQDLLVTLSGFYNPAWDAIFRSRGKLVEGGYDVEVAIPFRSLRFDPSSDAPWKILFKRKFVARDEYVAWPATRGDDGPELLQYAELRGVAPTRSGIGLEIQPTLVVRTGQDRDEESGELAWRKPGFPETVDPGVGVKWQLTPSLALDATFNPDFSQIEADPNRIDNNLRFAFSLPERRPFFLEGRELYNGFLLYTRSIVDPIYGVKLSGKKDRVSVGILHALDEAPSASVVGEHSTPGFMEEDVEGSLAFVSHAETRIDIGDRSNFELAYSDKELVRDGRQVSGAHVLNMSSRLALDDVSQIDAAVAYSVTGPVGERPLHGPAWYAEYGRSTRLTGFGGGTGGSTVDFRTENGFFPRPGVADVWAWGNHRFELEGPLEWISVNGFVSAVWEGVGEGAPVPASSNQSANINFRLPAQTSIHGHVSHWDALFEGKDFGGGFASFSLYNGALEGLTASAGAGYGDAIRYSDSTQTARSHVFGTVDLRAARRLSLGLSTNVNWIGRPGESVDRLWIYRARGVIGIMRALSVRLIVQGRNQTVLEDREPIEVNSSLDFSALVTLLPRAGTSIHVGFGERLEWGASSKPQTTRRDLFLKGSLVIRL